jgi:GTP-binding protein
VVVDARRGVEADERELLAWLETHALPTVLVATKLDKLGRAGQGRALARLADSGAPVVGFSARSGEGRDALWKVFGSWIAAPARG